MVTHRWPRRDRLQCGGELVPDAGALRLPCAWNFRLGYCDIAVQPPHGIEPWYHGQRRTAVPALSPVLSRISRGLGTPARILASWPADGGDAQLRSDDVQRCGLSDGPDRGGVPGGSFH